MDMIKETKMKKIFFKKKTRRWILQIANGHNKKDKNKSFEEKRKKE